MLTPTGKFEREELMQESDPLAGIRVLDFTWVLSGPFSTALLGDLGAEIIKVESPRGDLTRRAEPQQNGESAYFFCVNRNKKSISIDLKKPEGVEIIRRLVKDCDVLVENFRPGVMERLGLGYDEMAQLKPDLIYTSLTAFGRTGPYQDKPGYELIVQALTGLVDVTTPPDGAPAKIQVQLVDLCAGLFLAYATLAALYDKLATGRGQRVETSLLESTLAMMTNLAGIYFMTGRVPTGMGTKNPQVMPSQAFKTRDSYVAVVVGSRWESFCRALGRPEWASDPQYGNDSYRIGYYDEMVDRIEAITTTKTTREWLQIFAKYEVAASQINTVEEAFQDPGVQATGMVQTIEHPTAGPIEMLRPPWKMSNVPDGIRQPPPVYGQHTVEVLQAYGFTQVEIDDLLQKDVIFSDKIGP